MKTTFGAEGAVSIELSWAFLGLAGKAQDSYRGMDRGSGHLSIVWARSGFHFLQDRGAPGSPRPGGRPRFARRTNSRGEKPWIRLNTREKWYGSSKPTS